MFTRDDLPVDARLREPIEVTVTDVTHPANDRVDVELTVLDGEGHPLQMNIWSTHDLHIEWIPGHRYNLRGVRTNVWTKNGEKTYRLSSTRGLSATDLGPASTHHTRLLFVGDTHVGYRHRPTADKPTWARDVDTRTQFSQMLAQAHSLAVDAVIHTGDIFDDQPTQADLTLVRDSIADLCNSGIHFLSVRGNHDPAQGRRCLDELETEVPLCSALETDPVNIGSEPVIVYGIDYTGDRLPTLAPEHALRVLPYPNIVTMHDTPYPVVDSTGKLLHQCDGPDLTDFLARATLTPDLIVSGHMHVGRQATVKGTEVPVLITGPTAPISTYKKDNQPSTWLVTVTANSIDIDRQPL